MPAALTSDTRSEPPARTGDVATPGAGAPSWPLPFTPQHHRLASVAIAQLWLLPDEIDVKLRPFATDTGIDESVVLALPSRPPLLPQHTAWFDIVSAHE